jgi:hypothetical protein
MSSSLPSDAGASHLISSKCRTSEGSGGAASPALTSQLTSPSASLALMLSSLSPWRRQRHRIASRSAGGGGSASRPQCASNGCFAKSASRHACEQYAAVAVPPSGPAQVNQSRGRPNSEASSPKQPSQCCPCADGSRHAANGGPQKASSVVPARSGEAAIAQRPRPGRVSIAVLHFVRSLTIDLGVPSRAGKGSAAPAAVASPCAHACLSFLSRFSLTPATPFSSSRERSFAGDALQKSALQAASVARILASGTESAALSPPTTVAATAGACGCGASALTGGFAFAATASLAAATSLAAAASLASCCSRAFLRRAAASRAEFARMSAI